MQSEPGLYALCLSNDTRPQTCARVRVVTLETRASYGKFNGSLSFKLYPTVSDVIVFRCLSVSSLLNCQVCRWKSNNFHGWVNIKEKGFWRNTSETRPTFSSPPVSILVFVFNSRQFNKATNENGVELIERLTKFDLVSMHFRFETWR